MEKWNEISFNLSEKKDLSEDKFELIVIQILGFLGWRKYTKDLEIQPIFKTYHGKSKRMDILVKSKNENLFVIEVKKPGLPIIEDHIFQLKEYMRFLKLDFGLLFGKKIQIYYDGKKFNNKDFTLLDEIEYKNNNPKGLEFVKLFEKETFSEDKLLIYAEKKFKKIETNKLESDLKEKLISKDFREQLIKKIKLDLLNTYSETMIEKVFSDIKLSILDKSISYSTPKQTIFENNKKQKNSLNLNKRENGYLAIGKYVRKTLNELIDSNLIDSDEIIKLQRKDYSIETFHIRYPFLRKVLISDNKKVDKYWKPIVIIKGEKYFVCSEWYEVPTNNDRLYYEKWLRKMRNTQ